MSTPATHPPEHEPPSELLYRLYALWMLSVLLLVLLVIVLTLLGTGRLRRHAVALSEQTQAIEQLRDDLSRMQQELSQLQAAAFTASQPSGSPRGPVTDKQGNRVSQPAEPSQPTTNTSTSPKEQTITALLDSALAPNGESGGELADPVAASQALREALENAGGQPWSGETWARLALAARLLNRDGPAEAFAENARNAQVFPRDYYAASARQMLSQGRLTEAVVFANRLYAENPDDARAALLLGEAYCAQGDLAAAALAVEKVDSDAVLGPRERLRLGRLLIELELWDRLEALVNTFDVAQEADPAQVNFLRAVLAIQQDRLPEALAILDQLLADSPGDYDFQTWRGVALLSARQFEAAREALKIADAHPDRPEAWYWRGVLEVRAGSPDDAIPFFEKALAASQRHAPTWEALGTIALNRGDLPAAMQDLEHAVAANPRRASAHFLIAIIHAKTLRPTATADALRTALALDPSLLEEAQQTEVIRRLFTDDELEALADGPSELAPPPDEAEPG
jgi:tetratricopeptide (TPR) repeat protein